MPDLRRPTTVQLSDEVVVVEAQSGNTPLTNGQRADTRNVTLESNPYPNSKIIDLNWISLVDVAESGIGMTFEYDEQRKSLYVILGSNHDVGNIKRRERHPRRPPTVQLSDEVVVVEALPGNTPLTKGERAETRSVTLESDRYPNSTIKDLNWISLVDVAESGVGMTFEYDEQRMSLYVILGTNREVGTIKRKRRITKDSILTHWKWVRRVIFGNWDRDLEKWLEEDETRETRQSTPSWGTFASPGQAEDQTLGVEIEAGRRLDYLELWRTRIYGWSRFLEFASLGSALAIAYVDLPLRIGIPGSVALFVLAWLLDEVKSKNRRWKARR